VKRGGGCLFAPGASGNIVADSLVFMLESVGLRTGVDLDARMVARQSLADALPGEPLYGSVVGTGLPLGFRAAAGSIRGLHQRRTRWVCSAS
jgi:hydroxymethylglutaryl-CoA lyase